MKADVVQDIRNPSHQTEDSVLVHSQSGVPEPGSVLVEMRGISKQFGPVVANDNISLTIRQGEILAVLGENGAGKTTLMNILSGMVRPDAGSITVRGEEVMIASPQDALRRGIGTVYQHFTLVPNLSVIENVVLGTNTGFVLDLDAAEFRLLELLGGFAGMAIPPHTEVRHLSLGQRQRVEIVKALYRGSDVLLLDEPTSVLTPVEVEELVRILLRLKAEGVGVVLITHKLEEALEVSDRIAVLRQGRKVGELEQADLHGADRATIKQHVVELMFGGQLPEEVRSHAGSVQSDAPVVLSLRNVSARDDRGAPAVRDLDLDVHAGEVFGIAGVDGNGQKELGEVIAGQRAETAGRIALEDKDITGRGTAAFARLGIGYVTDDRLGEGCIPHGSVADNMVLKSIASPPFSKRFLLHRKEIENHARSLIEAFDVRTPGSSTRISLLSGGNVQKVLLARELASNPKVLVCNKPTNGLDVKTARFVLDTLRAQADARKVVILISSELDEILDISDRIGVMYNGRLVDVFPRADADIEAIGHLMLGGRVPA